MGHFLGTHRNRLDAKGRVSVPAPFRAALRALDAAAGAQAASGSLVLRPSHKHACIEAWPGAVFEALAQPLDRLDLFSEAHDDLASVLYAEATPVEGDREGRIVLPEPLARHAGLRDEVVFMGLGRIFQIWSPEAAEARRSEARARAAARGLTLPPGPAPA